MNNSSVWAHLTHMSWSISFIGAKEMKCSCDVHFLHICTSGWIYTWRILNIENIFYTVYFLHTFYLVCFSQMQFLKKLTVARNYFIIKQNLFFDYCETVLEADMLHCELFFSPKFKVSFFVSLNFWQFVNVFIECGTDSMSVDWIHRDTCTFPHSRV